MEDDITDRNILTVSGTKTEGNERGRNINLKKENIILKNYYKNLYKLESQAIISGFGKMVNAKNQTNPKYSFGKEKRFFTSEKKDDLPYLHRLLEDEKYGNVNIGYHHHQKTGRDVGDIYPNNKRSIYSFNSKKAISPERLNTINFVSNSTSATDYYYNPPPPHKYKYSVMPNYSFGRAKRDTEIKPKTYDYYKLTYDKKTDKENIDKKWSTHVVGGDIGVDNRFSDDKKLYYDSLTPGPGRYNPNYNYFKYKQNKYGYMGIKIKDDRLKVSTLGPKKISLTPYNIKYLIGSNQSHKLLNKSCKFNNKNENKENKYNNSRNNYMKYFFFRDQIEAQKKTKTNSSLNDSNEEK